MMRYVRIAVILLFLCSAGIYGFSRFYTMGSQDNTYPVIESDREVLEIPSSYTEDMLLEGLTAWDDTDGDLTDQIMIRGTSPFVETGEPLVFQAGRTADALSRITAYDVVEGDLTSQIVQVGSTVDYRTPGDYVVSVQVTNRFGDYQSAELPVHVVESLDQPYQIRLTQPLIYLGLGEGFDPYLQIQEITDRQGNPVEPGALTADSNLNAQTEGCYEVHYMVGEAAQETEEAGEEGDTAQTAQGAGETWMTIIVRE